MIDDERLGPPPVEPMSDAAWSRVERNLWSRLDAAPGATSATSDRTRPPRPWWIVAAPLAAAAAIIAIVVGWRTGTIEVTSPDEPSRVVSGTSPSSVSFGDSHIELDAGTALAMSHEGGHPLVLLERGAAWFSVAPRMQRPDFVVRAGDAMVRVVGTRFRVARSTEQIAVDVDRGLVGVQFRGRTVEVGAGQHWSSDAPAEASLRATVAQPDDPVVSSEPVPDPPKPAAAATPASGPTPPGPRPSGRSAAKPAPDAGAALAPKLGAAPAADIDHQRAEYERLAELEPRSPDAALSRYLTIARGTSRWADLALFAAARLAADRHDHRAETLLSIYLQRFPNGANATDARQLLARLKGDRP